MDIGIHRYDFKLDDFFLTQCEESPYTQANVDFEVIVDRRANMIALDVTMKGHVQCTCDRCIAPISLPIQSEHRVFLKVKEGMEAASEDDIIYIEPGLKQFSIVSLLYDIFVLAVPIKKIYNCEDEEPRPCDMEILNRLEEDLHDENKDKEGPSVWDELRKNLEFN
jgi:uncharacterized metal-binding protein YceD (DUF177 family)